MEWFETSETLVKILQSKLPHIKVCATFRFFCWIICSKIDFYPQRQKWLETMFTAFQAHTTPK